MRLLIVSDLHANLAALERVVETADATVFLGDAVDYGPDPAAAVDWVRRRATYAVRGNHDEAVGKGGPTGAAPAWADLAEASAGWTRDALSDEDRAFLGSLPLRAAFSFGGARFVAVHAAPLDPLYTYLPPETPEDEWERQLADVEADWLLYGHTHRPLLARFGRTTVLNPGSVGQPRTGAPLASYAMWDDGDVFLAARAYDVERSVLRLERLPLERAGTAELARILRTGATRGRAPVPPSPPQTAAGAIAQRASATPETAP
ncbi:MAG: YfcE family phosphodiesterase [Chloroflexi bacterium]|nr:YfcE family phosphodiesterase [Chloroflexota bacterium]